MKLKQILSGMLVAGNLFLIAPFSLHAATSPIGYVDFANCTSIAGWAFDPDTSSAQVAIHIYKDGPAGTGTPVAGETSGLRPDVNAVYVISGNHGFTIPTPDSFKDGRSHTLYVYAIDNSGDAGSLLGTVLLANCAGADAPSGGIPPSPTNLSSSCPAGSSQATMSWTLPAGYPLSYFRIQDSTTGANIDSYAIPENRADNGPATSVTITPGHSYHWWVHTRTSNSVVYSPQVDGNFSCPAPIAIDAPAPTPVPVGGLVPIDGPTATPVPKINHLPVGYLEAASCAIIGGWAYDSDVSSSPISIHIYDGPAGSSSNLIGGYSTEGNRPDVNAGFGITGNHGFTITTPASLKDGKTHNLYAYAIDSAGGTNALIGSQAVNCPKAVESTPPTAPQTNHLPVGTLEAANCTIIGGWAYDPDASGSTIAIHIYKDGPAGTGTPITGETLGSRSDINSVYALTGNHGFTISTPDSLKDGKAHQLYVYGLDSSTGATQLTNSPLPMAACNTAPILPAAPVITTEQLFSGTVGVNYGAGVSVAYSGASSITFTVSGLPEGIKTSGQTVGIIPLNGAATLQIGGIPTKAGTYSVNVTAQVQGGSSVTKTLILTIAATNTEPAASSKLSLIFSNLTGTGQNKAGDIVQLITSGTPGQKFTMYSSFNGSQFTSDGIEKTIGAKGQFVQQMMLTSNQVGNWKWYVQEKASNPSNTVAYDVVSAPATEGKVVGYLDAANCDIIGGWTYDSSRPGESIQVRLIVEGLDSGKAADLETKSTTDPRPDVNAAYGITGTHGFTSRLPDVYRDGTRIKVTAYGLSKNGTPTELGNKIFSCSKPIDPGLTNPKPINSIGYLDAATCDVIAGWAYDPDHASEPLSIKVLASPTVNMADPSQSNKNPEVTLAETTSGSRLDVNQAFSIAGNHGFKIQTPSSLKNGGKYTISVFAYDLDAPAGNAPIKLTNTVLNFSCPAPPIGPHVDPAATIISVHAKGTVAAGEYPRMELRSGTLLLNAWYVTADYADYSMAIPTTLSDNIRVYFTNDYFANGEDRNLTVDYITVNGKTYQSEDIGTFGKGVYVSGQGCISGFQRGETLHCNNGYFEYPTLRAASVSSLSKTLASFWSIFF